MNTQLVDEMKCAGECISVTSSHVQPRQLACMVQRHPDMTLHLSILIGAFIELNISSFHINNTTEEIVGTVILSRGHKPFYQFHRGEINLYYKLQPAK